MIRFRCPHCGHAMKAPDDAADKVAACAKCKTDVVIPRESVVEAPRPKRVPVPPAPAASLPVQWPEIEPPPRRQRKRRVAKIARIILLACRIAWPFVWQFFYASAVIFLAFFALVQWIEPPSPYWLIGYLGIVAVTWQTRDVLYRFLSVRNSRIVVALLCLIALWSYHRTARYSIYRNEGIYESRTDYWRSGVPYHKSIFAKDSSFFESGPVSESGQPHGCWNTRYGSLNEQDWYWYGEKVTEGTWRLREKL